jgi:hypothetical protein
MASLPEAAAAGVAGASSTPAARAATASDIELGSTKDIDDFDEQPYTLPAGYGSFPKTQRGRRSPLARGPFERFRSSLLFDRILHFLRGPDPPHELAVRPLFPKAEAWLARLSRGCRPPLLASIGSPGPSRLVRPAALVLFCVIWIIVFGVLTKISWFDTSVDGADAQNPTVFLTGTASFWAKDDGCGLGKAGHICPHDDPLKLGLTAICRFRWAALRALYAIS